MRNVATLGMLADPCTGSEVWDALDREVGKSGENPGQIVTDREFPPAAVSTIE